MLVVLVIDIFAFHIEIENSHITLQISTNKANAVD